MPYINCILQNKSRENKNDVILFDQRITKVMYGILDKSYFL